LVIEGQLFAHIRQFVAFVNWAVYNLMNIKEKYLALHLLY